MSGRGGWLGRSAAAVGAAAAGGALALAAGARQWQRESDRLVGELGRGEPGLGGRLRFEGFAGLPPPVERYLRLTLADGQPLIAGATVRQQGTFRGREGGDPAAGWAPFTAVQRFTASPPGFLWDARIRMGPLVAVRVRDGYVHGRASMRGAVAALIPVVSAADGPALRAGALQRWLAEAVWLPTALLPGAGVSWSAVDDYHALATATDGPTSVSLQFEFGPGGEIVAARAPGRPRAGKDGRFTPTPWGGRYHGHERHDGMLVPTEAEVFWVVNGREEPYYRGRNETIGYTFTNEEGLP